MSLLPSAKPTPAISPSHRPVALRHLSPGWEQAINLRLRLLRQPLGMAFSAEELASEGPPQIHPAILLNDRVVACAQLIPSGAVGVVSPGVVPIVQGVWRLRQVTVEDGFQGRGLGRRLMDHTERLAHAAGGTELWLHAREPVVGFYLRLGYHTVGAHFMECGLAHVRMTKPLAT